MTRRYSQTKSPPPSEPDPAPKAEEREGKGPVSTRQSGPNRCGRILGGVAALVGATALVVGRWDFWCEMSNGSCLDAWVIYL
jgi:hypothetical protein